MHWNQSVKFLLITGSLSLGVMGCNSFYDAFHLGGADAVNNNTSEGSTTPGTIDYALVNSQIFAPICVHCHSQMAGNSGGVNLETYQNVLMNLSDVQAAVATNFMPLNGPPLSQNLKNLLNTWIANGAPQSESPSNTETTLKTSEEVYFQKESLPKD